MNNVFNVDIITERDEWGDPCYQKVKPSADNFEGEFLNPHYSVSNLTESPEDATITRDLFSAYQYVDALRLGMKIAQAGFDEIHINSIDYED